jgi:hypothetical protein
MLSAVNIPIYMHALAKTVIILTKAIC